MKLHLLANVNALCVLVCAASASAPAAAAADTRTLTHGSVPRTYALHAPDGVKQPAPLLLVLHGRGGTGAQIRQHAGFDTYADRHGFVVAYPDGIDRKWADARQLTLAADKRVGTDDVGFLLALVDKLVSDGLVDKARVYVAGHSNGGFMSLTLACIHADRFKGVASVAGGLPRVLPGIGGTECAPSRPVTTMIIHATDDPLVPFAGGGVGRNGARGWIRSNDDTTAVFAKAASCSGQPVKRAPIDAKPKDGTRLIVEDRAGCAAPVVRAILENGGHGWPGHPPHFLRSSEEIDATQAIVSLFFEGRTP